MLAFQLCQMIAVSLSEQTKKALCEQVARNRADRILLIILFLDCLLSSESLLGFDVATYLFFLAHKYF